MLASLAVVSGILLAPDASAHSGGFGASSAAAAFSLPVWVVWALGALVVALSFVLVGLFLTREGLSRMDVRDEDTRVEVALETSRGGLWLGLVLVLLLVPPLFLGSLNRLPEILLWLGVWSVVPMASYLVGDLWARANPFAAVAVRARLSGRWPYPGWVQAWPSVVLLLALIGLEVLPGWGHESRPLTFLLVGYALATFGGMWAFGGRAWLENVEVFTRFFRWWGAVAPLDISRRGVRGRSLREIGASLPVRRVSDVAFTVAVLYGVNFDGFLQTRLGVLALDRLTTLGELGAHVVVLVVGYTAFLSAYFLAVRGIRRHSGSLEGSVRLAGRFALSLVPIAVGYHLAHNVLYAFEYAPAALAAFADPWGLGWSGAAALAAWSPPLPSPMLVGWLQLVVIVAAHVLAVLLAHELAFSGFTSRVQAARSEVPLTFVMVFYTFVGLAIVSSGYQAAPGV